MRCYQECGSLNQASQQGAIHQISAGKDEVLYNISESVLALGGGEEGMVGVISKLLVIIILCVIYAGPGSSPISESEGCFLNRCFLLEVVSTLSYRISLCAIFLHDTDYVYM